MLPPGPPTDPAPLLAAPAAPLTVAVNWVTAGSEVNVPFDVS